MRLVCSLTFSVLILCGAALMATAETAAPNAKSGATNLSPQDPTVAETEAALTAGECKRLGGKVFTSSHFCSSGRFCGTVDQYGQRHRVCVKKARN